MVLDCSSYPQRYIISIARMLWYRRERFTCILNVTTFA